LPLAGAVAQGAATRVIYQAIDDYGGLITGEATPSQPHTK
jgi:P pilus assembly chaperone PapD